MTATAGIVKGVLPALDGMAGSARSSGGFSAPKEIPACGDSNPFFFCLQERTRIRARVGVSARLRVRVRTKSRVWVWVRVR